MEDTKILEATDVKPEISLTEKAIKEVRKIKIENTIPEDYVLRVGVKGGGCSGLTYTLGFDAEKKDGDKYFDFDGVKVMVDWKSILYLSGTVIDYHDTMMEKGFTFSNPNAKKTCGCGSSFGV